MSAVHPIPWQDFERFLLQIGCRFERQKGSHRIYWRKNLDRPVVLPTYRSLPVFVIRNNLRTLGISVEEYLRIMNTI